MTSVGPVPHRPGATGDTEGHGDDHMNGHVHDELPALLGGELSPAAAAAVHAHLAACDRCRLDLVRRLL